MAGLMLESFPADAIAPSLHPGGSPRRRAVAISGAEPEVLLDVLRAEVNLAVWDRTLPQLLGPALRPLAEAAPGLPPAVYDLVMRLIAHDQTGRPADAAAVAAQLAALERRLPSP